MIKKIVAAHAMISLIIFATPLLAAPPVFVAATVKPSGETVVIPERAAQVAPNVFDLGVATDPATGEQVEGRLIVHRRANDVKGGSVSGGAKNQCYGFIARGTKWRVVEPWIANAANIRGLGDVFIKGTLSDGIAKWEDAADGISGNGIGVNILGDGATTTVALSADTAAPDGTNEVYFADIRNSDGSESNAIAITIVWYNRFTKSFVEWDQVYDDVSYDWSATGGAGKMDFDNIATHELGHSIGLADLYNSCTEETMYGYASYGETKKRSLNAGDIAGTNALY